VCIECRHFTEQSRPFTELLLRARQFRHPTRVCMQRTFTSRMTALQSIPFRHARVRAAVIYSAAWLPFVAINAGVIVAMTDAHTHAAHIIAAAFLNVLAPAIMGIGVWFAAARLSWPEHPPARLLAAHAALSMVYAAGWVAWQTVIAGPLGPWRTPDYDMWRYVLPWQAAIGFILYGVVAGVSYAVWYARAISVSPPNARSVSSCRRSSRRCARTSIPISSSTRCTWCRS
jgi:hypothetical protein